MSIQRENTVDRYIIAKQDNVIYMAFQSEPSLSQWIEHDSFTKGIPVNQTHSLHPIIPLYFLRA